MAYAAQSTGRHSVGQRTGASGAANQTRGGCVAPARSDSSFQVRLTADLVWSIEREISATLGTYGIVETGGYLVSHRSDYVGIQTGPGPKSTHAPSRFQLDDSAATRWLQSDALLRIVGDWHLHPSWDGTPSDHDVRVWAGHCTRSMSCYLGIVATKGELGFMTPELHGWVAFWDGDTAVCEPALLTGW